LSRPSSAIPTLSVHRSFFSLIAELQQGTLTLPKFNLHLTFSMPPRCSSLICQQTHHSSFLLNVPFSPQELESTPRSHLSFFYVEAILMGASKSPFCVCPGRRSGDLESSLRYSQDCH
jgi:hypothetical protein